MNGFEIYVNGKFVGTVNDGEPFTFEHAADVLGLESIDGMTVKYQEDNQ